MFQCHRMMLSILLAVWFVSIAEAGTACDIRQVPKGWVSPSPGYWMDIETGRDVVSGWQTAIKERDAYRRGYEDLRGEIGRSSETQQAALLDLARELETERQEWRRSIQRERSEGILWGVLIGGVVGAVVAR